MYYNLFIVILCVLLAGSFAGLTLALFGIKLTTLERKIRLGDKNAMKIYRIRKKGNLLLCTLLLGNVASYTILAIFLGSITSGVVAGIIATSLIFVFGEILPQAIFPRYAFEIGARLSWLVWILIILFYPIAAPIAWLLDRILGEEPPVLWTKAELGEIIKYHEDVGDGIIDKDEERIILGALSFSELEVADIMIPRKNVLYLEENSLITQRLLAKLKKKGHGRIPVYSKEKRSIVGILYSKDLLGLRSNIKKRIRDLLRKDKLIVIGEKMNLDQVLNIMIKRKMYMAIVIGENENFSGIVTMEDIMEEILKMELEEIKA